jgi:hypothetical protein
MTYQTANAILYPWVNLTPFPSGYTLHAFIRPPKNANAD